MSSIIPTYCSYSDNITGLPKILNEAQINCTYAIFEGAESRRDLEFTTATGVSDGKTVTAPFKTLYPLKDILPIRNTRIIFEFRAPDPQAKTNRDVLLLGWTSFELFNERNYQPEFGSW